MATEQFGEIDPASVRDGDRITFWRLTRGHLDWGQGGVAVVADDPRLALLTPMGTMITWSDFSQEAAVIVRENPAIGCDYADGDCKGDSDWVSSVRALCAHHAEEHYARLEWARGYDSDVPPAWFDETFAGERRSDDY